MGALTTRTSASAIVTVHPDALFRTLADIAALPTWNARMTHVVDQPAVLEPGAEWVPASLAALAGASEGATTG